MDEWEWRKNDSNIVSQDEEVDNEQNSWQGLRVQLDADFTNIHIYNVLTSTTDLHSDISGKFGMNAILSLPEIKKQRYKFCLNRKTSLDNDEVVLNSNYDDNKYII